MKSRIFNNIFILIVIAELMIAGGTVIYRDPFFHYHKPYRDDWHLEDAYSRYYNDGFLRFFEYDSIILGTSMCNNFRTSMVENLFGVDVAIKINASGSYFNETDVYLQKAFEHNPNIKLIVRSIDLDCLNIDKDAVSQYAEEAYYLKDNNIFNDVKYIFNKKSLLECSKTGHVDWDEYLSWRNRATGKEVVLGNFVSYPDSVPEQKQMDDSTSRQVLENVEQNIVAVMQEHPDTEFYLFLTPYSICAWAEWIYSGELDVQIQTQRIAIEEILRCENVHLYSFCNDFDMVCNLDNYTDKKHYAEWANDDILNCMYQGNGRLTIDNYKDYLAEMEAFYTEFPYNELVH